jgi:N6-L-threonylcarbamoyladenine synthase
MCVFYMKFHVSDFVSDEFVQRVAVQHLEDRCRRALEWARTIDPSVDCLVVSGGVASNKVVRSKLNNLVEAVGLRLVCPPPRLCTDNGVSFYLLFYI